MQETIDKKNKHAGRPLTPSEMREYNEVWDSIDRCTTHLAEQEKKKKRRRK